MSLNIHPEIYLFKILTKFPINIFVVENPRSDDKAKSSVYRPFTWPGHLAALLVNLFREGNVHQERYVTAPYTHVPDNGRWTLPLLYLVFILVEIVLYLVCKKYMRYKAANPGKKWLRYI
jgi:hypothetical protein